MFNKYKSISLAMLFSTLTMGITCGWAISGLRCVSSANGQKSHVYALCCTNPNDHSLQTFYLPKRFRVTTFKQFCNHRGRDIGKTLAPSDKCTSEALKLKIESNVKGVADCTPANGVIFPDIL